MQQVKFGSAAVEGEVTVTKRKRRCGGGSWFSLALKQDGVF